MAILGASLALAASSPPVGEAPVDRSKERQLVAMLDGEPIYLDEIQPGVALEVYKLETDIRRLLANEAEALVERRLLDREARARGVSVAELLGQEVDAKVAPPAEQAVEAYFREHPEAPATDPVTRQRVAAYLAEKARIERRLAFVADLRSRVRFELVLPSPAPPRSRLDLAGAPVRGPEDAPVTVVHFAGFDCGRCARSADYLRRLMEQFPGRIRWAHRTLFGLGDEVGLESAELGMAAQEAGRFWQLHDRLFSYDGRLQRADLERLAVELGLSRQVGAELWGDLDRRFLGRVRAEIETASRIGIEAPPVIFVNGRYFSATFPYDQLVELVGDELSRLGAAGRQPETDDPTPASATPERDSFRSP